MRLSRISDGFFAPWPGWKDNLAGDSLRLAPQKKKELALPQQRIDQIEDGKQENNRDAAKIFELAQNLAK